MIRGLDDEDVDHLNEVDQRKILSERKQKEEELKELQDYRAKVAELQDVSLVQKPLVSTKLKPVQSSTQKAILLSIKRKASSSHEPQQKRSLIVNRPSALKCVAVLPGIGDYKDSDESDCSSDALEDANSQTDIQRLIRTKKAEQCDE